MHTASQTHRLNPAVGRQLASVEVETQRCRRACDPCHVCNTRLCGHFGAPEPSTLHRTANLASRHRPAFLSLCNGDTVAALQQRTRAVVSQPHRRRYTCEQSSAASRHQAAAGHRIQRTAAIAVKRPAQQRRSYRIYASARASASLSQTLQPLQQPRSSPLPSPARPCRLQTADCTVSRILHSSRLRPRERAPALTSTAGVSTAGPGS